MDANRETPLPEIESDVLALLDGYFKDIQQRRDWLLDALESHKDEVGALRLHNWRVSLDRIREEVNRMACDECMGDQVKLGLWPMGRGVWMCDAHREAAMRADGLTDAMTQKQERER